MYHPEETPQSETTGADRRRAGRIKTPGVICDWGEVLDVSAKGLRILHKGGKPEPEGSESVLTIRSRLAAFDVKVRLQRVTKLSFRKYQLGVEILEPDENARRELSILARAAAQGVSDYR